MTNAPQVSLLFVLASLLCARARAQFETTATVEPEMAATNREDPTASGTEIKLDDRVQALELLSGVLADAPGTRPVLFGAPGSFVGLSLRGADFQHTRVLLGELPLSNTDTGVFDFGGTPIADFDRIEVYRGGAPAWLSTGAIGGVVRLVPRQAEHNSVGANLEAGSFGTFRGQVEGSAVTSKVNAFHNVGFLSTQGDFSYTDDNGTLFEPEDDVRRRLLNAEVRDLRGFSHVRIKTGAGQLQTVFFGALREGGQPGPASKPALRTSRTRAQLFGALSFVKDGKFGPDDRAYKLQAMAGGGFVRDQFQDPFAEVGAGLAKDTDDRFANLYGRLAVRLEQSPNVQWTMIGTAQHDRAMPKDKELTTQAPPSARTEAAFVIEPRVHGAPRDIRLELRPSVRFGFSHAEIRQSDNQGVSEVRRDHFLPTIRVAGAIGPTPWLTIAASVYTGTNLPTILQLFGDRARILGNPDLIPERSLSEDVSVVVLGTVKWLSGSFEARFFRSAISDLIRGVRNNQDQIIFQNIDDADLLGVEIGARGELTEHAVVTTAINYLQTRNNFGNALPFRSPLTALSRLEGHTRRLGTWVNDLVAYLEIRHTKGGYADAANRVPFPTRTTLELGAQAVVVRRQLVATFSARNIFDVHTFDVLGFPLPGRSFAVSLSYKKEFGS